VKKLLWPMWKKY